MNSGVFDPVKDMLGASLFSYFLFFILSGTAEAQENSNGNSGSPFRPTIAIVIGILSIMFSLTFLLLMYAKFCHSSPADLFSHDPDLHRDEGGLLQGIARFSGIDKTVIESLPFFRFSSLRGSKNGLECSVCLSKFEDTEILRLLPKCKHAFHIDCVDQWLEGHSSCPLCRYKVDAEDPTIFTYSNSLRFLRNPSDLREDPDVELYVQREPHHNEGSSRFSVGGSFRKTDKGKKNEFLIQECGEDHQFLHKFKHRIIVSDVVFNNRWSDVNSSDLLSLNSEMLNVVSSKRFSSLESNSERFDAKDPGMGLSRNEEILKIREEMEKKRALESKINNRINRSISVPSPGIPSASDSDHNSSNTTKLMIPSGKRSMSEITNLPRFADFVGKTRIKVASVTGGGAKEDRVRRLWLPIARRTVQWFAGRERISQSQSGKRVSYV